MELKVNTSIPISFEKIEDVEDTRFMKVKVEVAHTGQNLNNSYFSKEVLTKMGNDLSGVPVVGFLAKKSDGETDFRGHELKLTITDDGIEHVYLGNAFGCVLEDSNARFETKLCDDGVEREFLVVDAYLWRKFSQYTDIFEKDGFRAQSMELQPESITGYFSEDKVFRFTDAKVEALCALGTDIHEAMKGATITKYSLPSIKDQLREMFEELKQSNILSNESSVQSNEDNTFSINEENESEEDQVLPENKKTKLEIAEMFSLTVNQLSEELSRKISEKTYKTKNWYDEEVERSKFYMTDFDESFVYAVDREQGYIDVKIPYSKNGDDVSFDFDSASRIKWSPIDWDGESNEEVATENFTVKILEEVKKDFDKAIEEKNEVSTKLEKQATSLLDLNEKFTSLQETVREKENQIVAKDQELETLKEFKLQIETVERQEKVEKLFAKYKKNLTKEDVESFKEKESTFTVFEEFEKEVKLFVADKVAENVSTSTNSNDNTHFNAMGIPQANEQEPEKVGSVWDRLEQSK